MTPLERLLAEELPTGAFGGPRELPAPVAEPERGTGPDPEAAAHRETLLAALAGLPLDARKTRHLHALPPAA